VERKELTIGPIKENVTATLGGKMKLNGTAIGRIIFPMNGRR